MLHSEKLDEVSALIDFEDSDGRKVSRWFVNPIRCIVCNQYDQVRESLIDAHNAVSRGYYVAGYVSYEAAHGLDDGLDVMSDNEMPLIWFGVFSHFTEIHESSVENGSFAISPWQFDLDRADYDRDIDRIKNHIARGETYQLNYTLRLKSSFTGDPLALFRHLRNVQNAAFSAYINTGDYYILSHSPELFFRVSDQDMVVKPMKGTTKRGLSADEDSRQAAWLADSEKNRAENLMIVDLLRNDLGKISEVGTVQVPQLFSIERYATLFQMTSTITSKLKAGTSLLDIFEALFPSGSITGAPKRSTMGLIRQLENSPREVYCGAIGMVSPDAQAVFNVAIRTLWINSKSGDTTFGVGGGITWDSDSTDEYGEILTKSLFLTRGRSNFGLLETMAVREGSVYLLDRHMHRLQESSRYFDFHIDIAMIKREVCKFIQKLDMGRAMIRLIVYSDGTYLIEDHPMPKNERALFITLAQQPVSRDNVFLYHKTTVRPYETGATSTSDVFDVLQWNSENQITEFCKGNVAFEVDGELITPPVDCGLLPGTLRQDLLEQGVLRERTIYKHEINDASKIWFLNSVRGMIPVALR